MKSGRFMLAASVVVNVGLMHRFGASLMLLTASLEFFPWPR